jgi:hypothetical protein
MRHERLFTDEQADRWLIRTHLKSEAHRVVTAVFWGRYTIEDATKELRGIAYMIAVKCKVEPAIADDVAVSAIDEEMQIQESAHLESLEAMTELAFLGLRDGADLAAAKKIIADEAARRPLSPPLPVLTAALEGAAQRHRKAEYWWKTREKAE